MEPTQTARASVLCEVSDGAARVTLNRPDALNAWTMAFGDELLDVLGRPPTTAVRVVLITGAGRAFSSGADLSASRPMTPTASRTSAPGCAIPTTR